VAPLKQGVAPLVDQKRRHDTLLCTPGGRFKSARMRFCSCVPMFAFGRKNGGYNSKLHCKTIQLPLNCFSGDRYQHASTETANGSGRGLHKAA
jgi:hypothetical protein